MSGCWQEGQDVRNGCGMGISFVWIILYYYLNFMDIVAYIYLRCQDSNNKIYSIIKNINFTLLFYNIKSNEHRKNLAKTERTQKNQQLDSRMRVWYSISCIFAAIEMATSGNEKKNGQLQM